MAAQEPEDAATLKFNADLQSKDTVPLTLFEVEALLLQRQERQAMLNRDSTSVGMHFSKTLEYVSRLAAIRSSQQIEELRSAMAERDFHKFEIAQMINLAPGTIEEVKALIPSLQRLSDDTIHEILDKISLI